MLFSQDENDENESIADTERLSVRIMLGQHTLKIWQQNVRKSYPSMLEIFAVEENLKFDIIAIQELWRNNQYNSTYNPGSDRGKAYGAVRQQGYCVGIVECGSLQHRFFYAEVKIGRRANHLPTQHLQPRPRHPEIQQFGSNTGGEITRASRRRAYSTRRLQPTPHCLGGGSIFNKRIAAPRCCWR